MSIFLELLFSSTVRKIRKFPVMINLKNIIDIELEQKYYFQTYHCKRILFSRQCLSIILSLVRSPSQVQ